MNRSGSMSGSDSPAAWKASMTAAASVAGGADPPPSMHFSPFHGLGLCEAVIMMPPADAVAADHRPGRGGGDDAQIDHVAPRGHQSVGRPLGQAPPGRATVAPQTHRGRRPRICGQPGPEGPGESGRDLRRHRLADDAAGTGHREHQRSLSSHSVFSSAATAKQVAWQPPPLRWWPVPIRCDGGRQRASASWTMVSMMCRAIDSAEGLRVSNGGVLLKQPSTKGRRTSSSTRSSRWKSMRSPSCPVPR